MADSKHTDDESLLRLSNKTDADPDEEIVFEKEEVQKISGMEEVIKLVEVTPPPDVPSPTDLKPHKKQLATCCQDTLFSVLFKLVAASVCVGVFSVIVYVSFDPDGWPLGLVSEGGITVDPEEVRGYGKYIGTVQCANDMNPSLFAIRINGNATQSFLIFPRDARVTSTYNGTHSSTTLFKTGHTLTDCGRGCVEHDALEQVQESLLLQGRVDVYTEDEHVVMLPLASEYATSPCTPTVEHGDVYSGVPGTFDESILLTEAGAYVQQKMDLPNYMREQLRTAIHELYNNYSAWEYQSDEKKALRYQQQIGCERNLTRFPLTGAYDYYETGFKYGTCCGGGIYTNCGNRFPKELPDTQKACATYDRCGRSCACGDAFVVDLDAAVKKSCASDMGCYAAAVFMRHVVQRKTCMCNSKSVGYRICSVQQLCVQPGICATSLTLCRSDTLGDGVATCSELLRC